MLDKKLVAILLAVMMIVSITTLAVPALSEDDEEREERDRDRSDKDKNDERDKVKVAVTGKSRVEYEIEIEDNMMELEVEVRNFDNGEYRVAIDCLDIPSDAQNPIIQGMLIVDNGRGEVKVRTDMINGEYSNCTLYVGERMFDINDFRIVTGEQERKSGNEGLEIKVEIIDGITTVKIEDEFITDIIDRGEIADLLLARLDLTRDDIISILKIERVDESDDVGKDRMKTRIHIKGDIAEVKFEYRFITNDTNRDRLVDIILDRLGSINADDIITSIDAKKLKKDDVKVTVDKVRSIVDDSLLRNVDRLDRAIGNDRAIISMRLTLEANDTRSFGSADMLFIKSNYRDIGRISITMITAEDVENLVACYNGDNIGRLDISDAEGFKVGTLKTFIDNITVSIPGVRVSIVEGDDCSASSLLSGSL